MKQYLFDTCIWSRWFSENESIVAEIDRFDADDMIHLSAIVWGEVIYGASTNLKNPEFDYERYRSFVSSRKDDEIFEVDRHVSEVYGDLKSKLFDKYAPDKKRRKKKRPEQLIDPVTSKELGIQENDLWLVAQAVTYNLILVTNDNRMKRILDFTPNGFKFKLWKC